MPELSILHACAFADHPPLFPQHVTLRHRFEYGTVTAFEEDDDAIMRRVLEQSAREAAEAEAAEAAGGAGAG